MMRIIAFLGLSLALYAQTESQPKIATYKVQGNVWMLIGAGANIAVQAGNEGVLLVDTGSSGITSAVLKAVRQISTAPIRYVINTSLTPDHVGGNGVIGALAGGTGKGKGPTPNVIAHEKVLLQMSTPSADGKSPYPTEAWPTDGYIAERRAITFNGEAIDILHAPSAHTDGDTLVYFRASNVLVAGDIFTTTHLPLINRKQGGSFKGVLDALNVMVDIAVPEAMQEGGTMIIPGHGRVCDEADLVEYRDMVHEIGNRMQNLVVTQKLSLEQVKAKHPVLGWEGRYGRPEWTADMLVESIYQELSAGGSK